MSVTYSSSDADLIADRRRLRRKLLVWRALAFGGVLVALIGIGITAGGQDFYGIRGPHIARFDVKGFISGEAGTLKTLKKLKDDDQVRAVMLNIDSPGGTVTGSEALLDAIKAITAKKPTVAVVTGTAASGAYVVALGTERIFARETSIVGSIGVLVQYPNVGKLLDTVGVKVEEIKSSPLKASPNGFEPTSPEAREALMRIVRDNYNWFKTLVKDQRKLTEQELEVVTDGRVFSGRNGVALKLVDALGGETEALAWLEAEKGIKKGTSIKDWKPQRDKNGLDVWQITEDSARMLGLETLANTFGALSAQTQLSRSTSGILALWNPSAAFQDGR